MCMADWKIAQQMDYNAYTLTADASGNVRVMANPTRMLVAFNSANSDLSVLLPNVSTTVPIARFRASTCTGYALILDSRIWGVITQSEVLVNAAAGAGTVIMVLEITASPSLGRDLAAI